MVSDQSHIIVGDNILPSFIHNVASALIVSTSIKWTLCQYTVLCYAIENVIYVFGLQYESTSIVIYHFVLS